MFKNLELEVITKIKEPPPPITLAWTMDSREQ
jgi:hypothetical protein